MIDGRKHLISPSSGILSYCYESHNAILASFSYFGSGRFGKLLECDIQTAACISYLYELLIAFYCISGLGRAA